MTPSTSTRWIYDKLWTAIEEVNQRYRFEVLGVRELQVARYGRDDFYDWHLDIGKTDTSTRKLSLSVQLSDPNDYEGGELVLHGYENEKPVKEIGSVIVFPSYLSHRVNRVTTGERWSLVARASVSLAEVSTLGKTGSGENRVRDGFRVARRGRNAIRPRFRSTDFEILDNRI